MTIEYDNLLVASHDALCLIIMGFIEANHNRTVVHLYFIFGTKFLVDKGFIVMSEVYSAIYGRTAKLHNCTALMISGWSFRMHMSRKRRLRKLGIHQITDQQGYIHSLTKVYAILDLVPYFGKERLRCDVS